MADHRAGQGKYNRNLEHLVGPEIKKALPENKSGVERAGKDTRPNLKEISVVKLGQFG